MSPVRFALVVAFVAPTLAGCEGPGSSPAAEQAAQSGPEERFASFVEALKRHIEEVGSGAALSNLSAEPGSPIARARTTVSDRLIPPATPSDPYRGTVTLLTKWTVSSVLPPPEDSAAEEAKSGKTPKKTGPEEGGEGAPAEGAPALVTAGGEASRMSTAPIQTIDDEEEKTFELEYRDGRWVLLTEVDRENEPWTALALEYALKRQ